MGTRDTLIELFEGKYYKRGGQDYYFISLVASIQVEDYVRGGGITYTDMGRNFDELITSIMNEDGEWIEITQEEFKRAFDGQVKQIADYTGIK